MGTMNAKQALFFLVLWALFLSPAACVAGAVDHVCPDDTAIKCGHELHCSADPCNIVFLSTTTVRAEDSLPLESGSATEIPTCPEIDSSIRPVLSLPMVDSLEPPALPMPPAALPLLY